MPLPDVPQADYDRFQSDRFTEDTQNRLKQLDQTNSFLQATGSRIASLGYEPVEVAAPSSPILRGPVSAPPMPQFPQPTMPQLPGFPSPFPQPAPQPGPAPGPGPMPAPVPGAVPGQPTRLPPAPLAPPAQPARPIAPPVPARPQGGIMPEMPVMGEMPGPLSPPGPPPPPLRPAFAPDTSLPRRPPTFVEREPAGGALQGVDASAPAMTAVNRVPPGPYQMYAREAATRVGIDPDLFLAQIQQESGFNPRAGSPAGAQGIAQIVPKYHPTVDPNDPHASLDYAANLMRSHLKTYGGDWEHALVAYNGGGGAVAAWDRGQPYAESRQYVGQILGQGRPNQQQAGELTASAAAPKVGGEVTPTAMAQSQFGDPQLTAAEAYAACGPAAAVRFMQAYGRNPTLREAVDLARTVGWTQNQGMAGITSQQRLMEKMGMPTRLVAGPQWDAFAAEAQTGNPVTISTSAHYFHADGYNPETRAFHVGRSGMDLRGGKEWMTKEEIVGAAQRLGGGEVQGALFANNPGMNASSTTVQNTPASLDDTRRSLSSQFSSPTQTIVPPAGRPTPAAAPAEAPLPRPAMPRIGAEDPQVQQLDRAVEMAYIPDDQRRRDVSSPLPREPLPTALAQPEPVARQNALNDLGTQIGSAIQNALSAVFGGPPGGPPGSRSPDDDLLPREEEQQQQQQTTSPLTQVQQQMERFRHIGGDPNLPELPLRQLGVPDMTPPKDVGEALERAYDEAMRRGIPTPGPTGQLGILDPRIADPFAAAESAERQAPRLAREAAEAAERSAGGVLRGNAGEQAGRAIAGELEQAVRRPGEVNVARQAAEYVVGAEGRRAAQAAGAHPAAVAASVAPPPRGGSAPRTGVPVRGGGGATLESSVRSFVSDPDVAPVMDDLLRSEMGGASPTFAVHAAGTAAGGLMANAYTDPDDPNRGAKIAAGAAAGLVGGRIVSNIAMRGSTAAGRSLSRSKPQQAWDAFVHRFTDQLVDLNHVQEDFARRSGKSMTDEMKVAYLARVDPTNRALVATENALGQSIRQVKNMDDLVEMIRLRTNISTAEGLGTKVEEAFLEGGIAPSTTRRMQQAQKTLEEAQETYARAIMEQREVAAGTRRTRESISLDTANTRVTDAQARLDAATDAAREAHAESAAEGVLEAPSSRLIRDPEQRDLIVAEYNAGRLNRQYERLFNRDPDDPGLFSLARQVARAEDRLSALRTRMGETTVAREEAIGARADAARTATLARPQAPPATPDLAAARIRLRYEKKTLERLQQAQARGEQGLVDDLARAWKRHDRAERDVQVAAADMPAAAAAQGQAQREGRIFEEGARLPDLQVQLQALRDKYRGNPKELMKLEKAAQDIFEYRQVLLEELIDARVITRETADELLRVYGEWTPTRKLDYMFDNSARGMPSGSRLNVNDNGFKSYTLEGYEGKEENHVASLIRYAEQVYSTGAKNRAFNALIDAQGDTATGGALKRIANNWAEFKAAPSGSLHPPNYRAKAGAAEDENVITGIRDGVKQRWVTDNPYIKNAVEMSPSSPLQGVVGGLWQKGAMATVQTATARNPKWLVKNVLRDVPTYLIGTMAEGGVRGNAVPLAATYGPAMATYMTTDPDDPNRLQKALAAGAAGFALRSAPGINRAFGPNLFGELIAGYADAFQGIESGRYMGKSTQEYLMRGGGMRGGSPSLRTVEGAQKQLDILRNPGGIQIKSMNDLSRLLKDAATFGWVKAIGSRFELGPRVAAMRVAERRGATAQEAMIKGRDVTIDFDRHGLLTKEVNRYIPFMNAGVQGGARFTRLLRDHPGGMALAGLSLVGGPAMATMEWNRADPQRSRDYDDVPEYVKRRGVVLMLPWTYTDVDGNRKPAHLDIDLAQFAPFGVAAQEGYDRSRGTGEPRGAGELVQAAAGSLGVPFAGGNMVEAATSLLPPPLSTVAQLAMNRDFYRDSTIANRFSDESASQVSKTLAPLVEQAVTRMPGQETARIRPSQIDFLVRDIANGLGQTGLDVSNLAAGTPSRVPGGPGDIPVAGGLASGFVRTTGGQRFEDVRRPTELLNQDIRARMRALGDYYEPSMVPDTIQRVPLRQAEQEEYQRLTNEYFNSNLRRVMGSRLFETERGRQNLRSRAMDMARRRAAMQVLRQIKQSGSSLKERVKQQTSAV